MRALLLLTVLAVACAPDAPATPAAAVDADVTADADAAVVPHKDAAAEVAAPDVAVVDVADVAVDPCAGMSCDDGNVCTTDSCTDGTCGHVAVAASCSDGNPCTVGDTCHAAACLPGAVTACSDGLACTVDSCVPAGGCAWALSATCDDGDACTADGCASTGCTHNTVICDDGNVCTSDACVAPGGCSYTPITNCCLDKFDCDDGNACTLDACTANSCTHSPAADWNPCDTGVCDGKGTCGDVNATKGMAFIAAGTFWMGCNSAKDSSCQPDEGPQHKVTLSAYYIDLTETTVGAYKACWDAGVCSLPGAVQPAPWATYPGLTDHPVNFVTWAQAQTFCKWRGAGFDLPTEAQWEMAARGSCEKNGSTAADPQCAAAMRTYPWLENLATCDLAVMFTGTVGGCGTDATWAVGSKPAGDSPYGLHDMAGNVWEWTMDWYDAGYYAGSPTKDPFASATAKSRVQRGGGWFDFVVRSAMRSSGTPDQALSFVGFRCSRAYP